MAKKYKLTLENIKSAVEKCPYVACKGPFSEDYEIFEAKEFMDWIADNIEDYGLKVYRRQNEVFFRVEITPKGQEVEFDKETFFDYALNAGAFIGVIGTIGAVVWLISSLI